MRGRIEERILVIRGLDERVPYGTEDRENKSKTGKNQREGKQQRVRMGKKKGKTKGERRSRKLPGGKDNSRC